MVKQTNPNKTFKPYSLQAFRPILRLACPALFLLLVGCGGGETGISSDPGSAQGGSGGSVGTGSGKASLIWERPVKNVDGTDLVDLAGFKVYYGETSPIGKENSQSIDVGNITEYTFDGFKAGTYYFAVTAYDTSGNESELSEEVSKEISEG